MTSAIIASAETRMSTRRIAFTAMCLTGLVVALILPFINPPYIVQNYTRIFIVALPVIGLNMLTGYGGLISLGQSAFFGIGAYVTAVLVADHDWVWWQTTPVAVALAFCAGMAVGVPSLRIRGVYLAVTTLVLAALFPSVILRFDETTGGSQGKSLLIMQPPDWVSLGADQFGYFVCLAVLLVAMLLMHNLANGRVGRALVAMRDNETAAATMGVNLARTKIAVFGVSAALAGLGGSLFSATQGLVSSETGYVTLTGAIQFICAMVIGGSTTMLGPLVGAAITERLPVLLSGINPVLAPVVYGLLLIAVVMLLRDGLVGGTVRLLKRAASWMHRRKAARSSESPHKSKESE